VKSRQRRVSGCATLSAITENRKLANKKPSENGSVAITRLAAEGRLSVCYIKRPARLRNPFLRGQVPGDDDPLLRAVGLMQKNTVSAPFKAIFGAAGWEDRFQSRNISRANRGVSRTWQRAFRNRRIKQTSVSLWLSVVLAHPREMGEMVLNHRGADDRSRTCNSQILNLMLSH
jgi:hypothetical protein